ncbi:MAG: DUF2924 domain-containing protein [Patescibacteria group bacterium]|nr:DUF2924 domain-containing protein [Patescibacteria group bacterium]
MERKEVALGIESEEKHAIGITAQPVTLKEHLEILTNRVDELTKSFNAMHGSVIKKDHTPINIPPGTLLFGKSEKREAILVVTESGFFIGQTKYNSLSAAAKIVSGTRRSGWTFWKTADGKTAKEAFNNG